MNVQIFMLENFVICRLSGTNRKQRGKSERSKRTLVPKSDTDGFRVHRRKFVHAMLCSRQCIKQPRSQRDKNSCNTFTVTNRSEHWKDSVRWMFATGTSVDSCGCFGQSVV